MPTVNYSPANSFSSYVNSDFPRKQNRSNGITYGTQSMPQKFNSADGTSSFSIGRSIYLESEHKNNKNLGYAMGKTSGNTVNIHSADLYIQRKKNHAIGRGTMPLESTPGVQPALSFKTQGNTNLNIINAARRRCRNSGSVPPKQIR